MFEKYLIVEQLGTGSFGEVVKAQCRVTGNYVAIKKITNAFIDVYMARKVLREISLLR